MGRIDMDFNQAIRQADELSGIASRLRRLANGDYRITIDNIAGNWKSTNADNFCRKGYRVRDNLLVIANNIEKTAGTLRANARRVYEAEKRAEEIARSRNHGGGGRGFGDGRTHGGGGRAW